MGIGIQRNVTSFFNSRVIFNFVIKQLKSQLYSAFASYLVKIQQDLQLNTPLTDFIILLYFFNVSHRCIAVFFIFKIDNSLFRIYRFNIMAIDDKAIMTSKETII